jgi:MFS family permease
MAGGSYRTLDRNIHILFLARIINRFGDFVQMLLVLILTVSIGMEEHQAGLFTTLTIFAASLGQLSGGFFADKYPRKYVMVVCQLSVAVLYVASGLLIVDSPMVVAYLILISSPFRGATWPVSHALIADYSEGEMERARAFSLLYLGSNVGVAVGPLVAAFLFSRNLFLLFMISAATLVVSAGLLGVFLPRQPEKDHDVAVGPPTSNSLLRLFFSNRLLVVYVVAFTLYNLIYVQHSFALPLQMNALFGTRLGTEGYGWLMTVNAVTVLLMTAIVTRLTIHGSRAMNMALGTLFYVVGFGAYAVCSSLVAFLGATFIWTLGEILLATNGNVFVNRHAPSTHRARFNSLVSVAVGIGSTIGPTAGGLLLSVAGFSTLWFSAVGVAMVVGVLFLMLRRMVIRSEAGC